MPDFTNYPQNVGSKYDFVNLWSRAPVIKPRLEPEVEARAPEEPSLRQLGDVLTRADNLIYSGSYDWRQPPGASGGIGDVPNDGRIYSRRFTQWVPAVAAGHIGFAAVVTITGNEQVGDILVDGMIPPALLPDTGTTYWVAEGSGLGGFAVTNAAHLTTQGQISGYFVQLHNHLGAWTNWGSSGALPAQLPPNIPTLFRITPATGAGNIRDLVHRYSVGDPGIPFRMTVGSITTLVPGSFVLTFAAQIVLSL